VIRNNAAKSPINRESPGTSTRGIVRGSPENFSGAPCGLDAYPRDHGRIPRTDDVATALHNGYGRETEGVMFDLITGKTTHIPNKPALPIIVTSIAEAFVLSVVVILPVLIVTDHVPEIPTMMAFVAAPPAPPPPSTTTSARSCEAHHSTFDEGRGHGGRSARAARSTKPDRARTGGCD
jgi:hypothetical protein